MFAVYVVKEHSLETISRNIFLTKFLKSEFVVAMKKDFILKKPFDNDEVIETNEVITTIDPLSRCRIKIPVRGKTCRHSQCFDLDTFLALNQNIPTWTCSICHNPAHIDDLIVDGLVYDILASIGEDDENIELFRDGSWCEKKEEVVKERKVKKARISYHQEESVKPVSDTIDLTFDSD